MRIKIKPSQKKRLLKKNAGVCCVCKIRGKGVNFHHIDKDPSNNVDENIAVLCVEEHDIHHRPKAYPKFNHMELTADIILKKKQSWENFVKECKKPNPSVLATICGYGTEETVVGIKIVFQWVDGEIEFERVYQVLDGPMETCVDKIIEEVVWLGKNIKIVFIDKPIDVEYCPKCNICYSRTLDRNRALVITKPDWKEKSRGSIYINPKQPSLAYAIYYNNEVIYQAGLHKCVNCLHFMDEKGEEQFLIRSHPSIRTQATNLVKKKISDWNLEKILIGTGNPDIPELIDDFELPTIWEKKIKKKNKIVPTTHIYKHRV